MNDTHRFALDFRILELTELLSAGCDPDFDATSDELEREFQELRCQLVNRE